MAALLSQVKQPWILFFVPLRNLYNLLSFSTFVSVWTSTVFSGSSPGHLESDGSFSVLLPEGFLFVVGLCEMPQHLQEFDALIGIQV